MDDSHRALVLGSGGATGLAWEVGVLAGLAEAGVELSAGTVVGTSAGAILGAHLAGGETIGKITAGLRARPGRGGRAGPGARDSGRLGPAALAGLLAAQLFPSRRHALAWLGRRAEAEWTQDAADRWVSAVAGDLAGRPWPEALVVVATDAATGRPAFLSAGRPADLASAVAASCAMPGVFPAVRIDGHLLLDGGLRSPANLDVAADAGPVLALAPLTWTVRAHRWPAEQAAQLRRAGTPVVLLTPDTTGRRAIGIDVLDGRRVETAFASGRALGASRADEVHSVWS